MRTYERSWRWWVKEKKQMGLVFIAITVMMLQFQMKGCEGCLETERIGLLELKSYLNSFLTPQDESILKSWSDDASSSDCCYWEGVNCSDAIGGHVVDLSLYEIMPDRYLSTDAPLPPPLPLNLSLLHSFPQLKTLNFSWNGFSHLFDPIHGYKSFQRLENLHTLDLSHNWLNNSVLPFLSAAKSLRTLDLGVNRLEGVFPPNELANMTKLRVLNLKWNEFSFFSVKGLINLRELEVLDLYGNRIKEVEAGDGLTTTKLKTLDLSENNFSEAAQLKGLQHLVELQVLSLTDNKFNHTGSIQVLKDMPKLQELDLSLNKFTDLDSLVFPSSLQVLNLKGNQLSSTPKGYTKICRLTHLRELDLSFNALTNMPYCLGLVFPSSLQVLNLKENQLSSTPKGYTEICRLTHLRELDLSSNALTSMPYCLGNLTRLRTLDLTDNQLNGNLSSFVYGLPSALEYLSLFHNNFNGSFLFKSLVNQTRLAVFGVSSEVGRIQTQAESSWVPLFQLKKLKLQNFILGSKIPGFLLHQHDLRVIDLSHNKLTGAFPTWFVQNNTKLETFLLNNNLLTELQLPRLVHGLQSLDISSNGIFDSIQEDIGNVFPNLRYINFSSNHFHGTIPSSMGEMKSLEVLDMSSNFLSGQLPKTCLNGFYSLTFLKLSKNQFQGKIFSEHANLTGLTWLCLDGNSFNGSLGKGLLNSKNLYLLDLSDNGISGTLPLWIGRMSSLGHLYMRGNQLKGPFPRQLQNLKQLQVIDISHNSFSGSIPSNLDFPYLGELRLQGNKFMGTIPDTLFEASALEVLDLRNNNLSGMILKTIGKNSDLRVLLLRSNIFQIHIPEKLCQVLSKVGILDLSHNKFKGVIPSCLGNMSFRAEGYPDFLLPVTGIAKTRFPVLQNWSYTSALYLDGLDYNDVVFFPVSKLTVDFLTKSRYEAYQGDILRYMSGLDLSSNELSGEIPVELGNLQNIRSLNLSNNHLSGSIPYSISELEDLESLDLSNNKLDGNIPPQLADLNNLGYFNVSFNNLSGEIPFNGHLITFDEKSYIGNTHLCGRLINKSCNPTGVPEPSASKQDNEEESDDDMIDMVWFYWTCGAVYITTSLALLVFLCIDSRWSREWFYRVDLLVYHLERFKRPRN